MEPKKMRNKSDSFKINFSVSCFFFGFQKVNDQTLHLSSSCEGLSWQPESASSLQSLWTHRAAARVEKKNHEQKMCSNQSGSKVTLLYLYITALHINRLPHRRQD